jgi:outer membrane protein
MRLKNMKKTLVNKLLLPLLAVVVMTGSIFAEEVTQTAKDMTVTAGTAVVPAVAAAMTVSAQVLTFDDCYKLAEEFNREFRMAKLDKQIAEAKLGEATSMFGPTISAAGGYQPVNKSQALVIPAGYFGLIAPMSVSLVPQYFYTARVSLTQPLFTFGKTMFGFKIAEEAYKIAGINFKKAEKKLNLDVISSFYGALIAQELFKANTQNLKSTEEYLKITQTKYANGQASNFDVLQAQVQYANAKPAMRSAEDAHKLSIQALKNTLAIPLETEIVLTGSPDYKKLEMTYEDIKKQFTEKNDDRAVIEASTNIAKYQKNLAIAALLPNIAFSANYSYVSTDSAFHREASEWQSSWDGTIGVQWTFFDGFKTEFAIKEASANAEKAGINKENMNDMLSIQLDQLFMSMQESSEIIEAADNLIKQAEEGFRIAKESYKNGLIQSVDLMNSETMLMQAKTNYYNALENYLTSMQKLKNYIE